MPSFSQKTWNSSEAKLLPLSVRMLCETPKRQVMPLKNFTAVVAVWLVNGIASIHLVNLSTATSKCVCPPGEDFRKGPTWSSPHWENGHASGIVIRSIAGACGFGANRWHGSHFMTKFLASSAAVG